MLLGTGKVNAELIAFLGRASKATYASGGGKVASPWQKGFTEHELRETDWYYHDSYAGFLQSRGQEIIYYKNKPLWVCQYGGGMTAGHMDAPFAHTTFVFLKKALMAGDKQNAFQARGPKQFADDTWQYQCEQIGTVQKFSGHETIALRGTIVFTHDFSGGILVD